MCFLDSYVEQAQVDHRAVETKLEAMYRMGYRHLPIPDGGTCSPRCHKWIILDIKQDIVICDWTHPPNWNTKHDLRRGQWCKWMVDIDKPLHEFDPIIEEHDTLVNEIRRMIER